VEAVKLIVMQSPPLPCYLVPLKPKYLPQLPLFEHFQPVVFPQHERPRFTPTQKWQHCSSAPVGSRRILRSVCSLSLHGIIPDDGGNRILRNADTHLDSTVSLSPLCRPQ